MKSIGIISISMVIEQLDKLTGEWIEIEVKDEETQLIYDTMVAEMEIQEVMDWMTDDIKTDER